MYFDLVAVASKKYFIDLTDQRKKNEKLMVQKFYFELKKIKLRILDFQQISILCYFMPIYHFTYET